MNDFAAIDLPDETATLAFGRALGPVLQARDALLLVGDLGAGKTTLARGLIQSLAPEVSVLSPTFTFVETYELARLTFWHFDLYRLEAADDIWELGFEDALENGVTIIEWPERAAALMPQDALIIRLRHQGQHRKALLSGGEHWKKRLTHLEHPKA